MHVIGSHTALELARANAHEGDTVAVVLVHVRLDLEHETAEVIARGRHGLAREAIRVGTRSRGEAQELLEERLDAKVGEGRAKERGRQLAAGDGIEIKLVTGAVKKLNVIHQSAVVLLANQLVHG